MSFPYARAKNISGSSLIFFGVTLADDAEYIIPDEKRIAIGNNDTVIDQINSGDVQIGNTSSFFSGVSDQLNHLKANSLEVDSDGRQIVKNATTDKGWSYIAMCIEVNLSKHGSGAFYCADKTGTDCEHVTAKIYDSNGDEVTDSANEADAVKTVLTFSPDYDFDIIAGSVWNETRATVDIRLYTQGGITALGEAGLKEFVHGLNLRYLEEAKTDGRSSKKLFRDHTIEGVGTFRGDNLVFTTNYPQGNTHEFMIMVEYYRA